MTLLLCLLGSVAFGQEADDAPVLIRSPNFAPVEAPREALLVDIFRLRMERSEIGIAGPIVFTSIGGFVSLASALAFSQPNTYGNSGTLLAAVGVPLLLVSSMVLLVRLSHRGAVDGELSILEYRAASLGVYVPPEP